MPNGVVALVNHGEVDATVPVLINSPPPPDLNLVEVRWGWGIYDFFLSNARHAVWICCFVLFVLLLLKFK